MTRSSSLVTAAAACALLVACAATPPAQPDIVATAQTAPPAQDPSKERLVIDFNTAGATLSPAAKAQLDGAARLYRDAQPEVMIVSGHTDKVGAEYPNLLLSARRADVVKRALVARGVPTSRLQIIAMGEAEPVPTIPPSRSVVVTWR